MGDVRGGKTLEIRLSGADTFAMWSGPKAAAPNARSPYTPTISVSNSGTCQTTIHQSKPDTSRERLPEDLMLVLGQREWVLVLSCAMQTMDTTKKKTKRHVQFFSK